MSGFRDRREVMGKGRLHDGFFLTRRASGPLLTRAHSHLTLLEARHSGIEVNSPHVKNHKVTEVPMVRKAESLREENMTAFAATGLRKYQILTRVADMVPSITEDKSVTVRSVDVDYHANRAHESFVSLEFDTESVLALADERANVWEALEEITGEELDWGIGDPKLRAVYANRTVPELAVRALGTVLENDIKRSPSRELVLSAAFLPEAAYLGQLAA